MNTTERQRLEIAEAFAAGAAEERAEAEALSRLIADAMRKSEPLVRSALKMGRSLIGVAPGDERLRLR